MGFSVINNTQNGVPYVQYGTNKEKEKINRFVNKTDKQITQMAYDISGQREKDMKFSKETSMVINTLPLIGGIATATVTKGSLTKKTIAGAKGALKTVGILAVPLATVVANNVIAQKSEKVKNAEQKHPLMTLAGLVGTSCLLYDGASKLAKKVAPKAKEIAETISQKVSLDKLAEKIDKTPKIINDKVGESARKIGISEGITKLSKKVPNSVKEFGNKLVNADITKTITNGSKTLGKIALKNPVTTVLTGVLLSAVGHDISRHRNIKTHKEFLKNDQNQAAKILINAYAMENESLKKANSQAAIAIEDAKKANIE